MLADWLLICGQNLKEIQILLDLYQAKEYFSLYFFLALELSIGCETGFSYSVMIRKKTDIKNFQLICKVKIEITRSEQYNPFSFTNCCSFLYCVFYSSFVK